MTRILSATANQLWDAARFRFPTLSRDEQRIGISLLHELSLGVPVTITKLAQVLDTSVDKAALLVKSSALSPFVQADNSERIQGFWGLSTVPTHHHLTVGARRLWAWCALDSLFLPELFGESAAIESQDPETGELVRLSVSPTAVEAAEPAGIMVSLMPPQAWDISSADRVIASACHFIFFFGSQASGERWQEKHPNAVLLTLDEAFALAKRHNAYLFGAELARRDTKYAVPD